MFMVEDSGPGEEDPLRKKLLELVEQPLAAGSRMKTSVELSFYLLLQIMEAHKGKVLADSGKDGLRFGFALPKSKAGR